MAIAERRSVRARATSRNDAIDELYAELRQLMASSTVDPSEDPEIQSRLARLRALQSEEAEAMCQRFNKSLHLKPGDGYRALEEARRLLAEYADPVSEDLPSPQ